MSYARWVGPEIQQKFRDLGYPEERIPQLSSVYVYQDYRGFIACCGCLFADDDDHASYQREAEHWNTQSIVDHLKKHRDAGHDVPDGIEESLWEDDKENFPDATEQ